MEWILKSRIFLADQLEKAENREDFDRNLVLKYLESPNLTQIEVDKEKPGTSGKKEINEEIESALDLLAQHAGFVQITADAKKRLRDAFLRNLKMMATQFLFAEQRRKDGLAVPFSSSLMWVLSLNEAAPLILKESYDETYRKPLDDVIKGWRCFLEEEGKPKVVVEETRKRKNPSEPKRQRKKKPKLEDELQLVIIDQMDSIIFEQQEAALCGQHALNMLLQGSYYTADVLAQIAERLDSRENQVLDEASKNERSQNMNASGYFSIQVMNEALSSGWNIDLVNINHPSMAEFKADPLKANAFFINFQEHWYVIRKFGKQWFELNSTKFGPKYLSETYLETYLHQLAVEGHSIFVVIGVLPECEANQLLNLCPYVPPAVVREKPSPVKKLMTSIGRRLGAGPSDNKEDADLAVAMALSMEDSNSSSSKPEDDDLQAAIERSLTLQGPPSTSPEPSEIFAPTAIVPTTAEGVYPGAVNNAVETPILGNVEQQRKDREKFLSRFD
ncbi:unnamed protein product [Caenorhabditis auriculariae]|uniref:ubiquitinyl hydrolase 1 n=1 Tax=Caenorhabditis auriculariae TaxID=2777116 RepID=A0A8S1H255_9PELO|nr:unnamed protein product [Caenorhabditis auriculariae]